MWSSTTVSTIAGCSVRRRPSAAGTNVVSAVGKLPKRSRAARRPAISASSCSVASSRALMARPWRARTCPASVSAIGRVPRSTSRSPVSRSSAATCWLTADWVSPRDPAAPENEPCSATSFRARMLRTMPIRLTNPPSALGVDANAERTYRRPMTSTDFDTDKLMAFVFRAVDEVGATLNCALVVMGDRLGYYRFLADSGPATAAELARGTGTGEPYAREWLSAQAAGGFVEYDPSSGRFTLP